MNDTKESGGFVQVSPLYPNEDVLRVIGEVAFLCFHSSLYQNWTMKNIARGFEPPVFLKQFHIYRARGVPRGIVTWAKLSSEVEQKHVRGRGLDKFEDWQSGDQLWIMDIAAPWGHGKAIIRHIMDTLQEDSVKTLRIHNGRKKIIEWYRKSKTENWKIRSVAIGKVPL